MAEPLVSPLPTSLSPQSSVDGRWSLQLPHQDPWLALLRRSGRLPVLLEAWLEERIAEQVPLEPALEQDLLAAAAEPNPALAQRPEDLAYAATLAERLRRFKQATFTLLVEERFTRTKHQRDRLIYSLLRSRSASRVEELALAIREGELDFAQAAIRWSEGPESASGGRIGPIAPGVSHPELNQRLDQAGEGELIGPFPVGDMHVLLRLDTRITTRLTPELQDQLIDELYREWMDQQLTALLNGESIEPIEYLPPA